MIDRVMAAGKHPNIVPLIDVNLDGDTPWVMFEFVQGGDLCDMIREWQNLPEKQRRERAMSGLGQLAAAVGHFHRVSPAVVHRDLKPGNILCDRTTGTLRITDFGIGAVAAKVALGEDTGGANTRGGRLLSYLRGSHTPLYSSPQQRTGADPDPRDDVYALGVIAYQMLTGDLAHGVGVDFGEDLREAGVSEELIDLIRRCVAQKPERRPTDGVELLGLLKRVGNTNPSHETKLTPMRGEEPVVAELIDEVKSKDNPGVIASIVEFLQEGTEAAPLTKADILARLAVRFPDRPSAGMMQTISCQLPSRLRREKGLDVRKNERGYWINPK